MGKDGEAPIQEAVTVVGPRDSQRGFVLNNGSNDEIQRERSRPTLYAAGSGPYQAHSFHSAHNRTTRMLSYLLALDGVTVISLLAALLALWYGAAISP